MRVAEYDGGGGLLKISEGELGCIQEHVVHEKLLMRE